MNDNSSQGAVVRGEAITINGLMRCFRVAKIAQKYAKLERSTLLRNLKELRSINLLVKEGENTKQMYKLCGV